MNIKVPTNKEDNYGYIFHLFRIAKNWKLKDIEERFNINKSNINLIEKMNNVDDETLAKMCLIYDVDPSRIRVIHRNSKNKYNWDYQKTLYDIITYNINKTYYKESCYYECKK